MKLIDELIACKTPKNKDVVDELITCIKEEHICNIEQLESLEKRLFTVEGKVLNNSQRIKYCFSIIDRAHYDYEGLSLNEINELKKLKDSITSDIEDKEKIFNIIKINIITNREIMFIKEAYEYILKGQL